MMLVSAAQLLSAPTGTKSQGILKLPWANGSLLSATLSPSTGKNAVTLSLAGYRMQIPMQQGLAMGQQWLLLVSRDAPLQFRFLREPEAMHLVMDMLAKKQGKSSSLQETQQQHKALRMEHGWHKLEQGTQPFATHIGASGTYIMLEDKAGGGARGMVQQEKRDGGFLLHGRVDLAHLGAVVFALRSAHEHWQMHIYSASSDGVCYLRQRFSPWLARYEHPMDAVALHGSVRQGLPDDFSFLSDVKI